MRKSSNSRQEKKERIAKRRGEIRSIIRTSLEEHISTEEERERDGGSKRGEKQTADNGLTWDEMKREEK